MPIWTSLSANIFSVLYWRRRIFLFQPLSHSHFSDLKPGGAHCKKGRVTNTSLARHPSVDRWWSTCTRVHLNSFFEVVLQQRTWALGFKLRMAEVALASAQLFCRSLPGNHLSAIFHLSEQSSWGGGYSLHRSRHEPDSTRGESHLAKVQGEHIRQSCGYIQLCC